MWAWLVLTSFFFILRAGGAIQSVPLCFFLSAVAGALFFSLDQLRFTGAAHPLLRLRQIVLVVVLVTIPSLFDPTTIEIENLPRLVLLVVAAVLILGIWAVDAVWNGWRPRRLVNGFQWVLLAIVVWFGVTTLASVEPRASLLGRYGSYEGFLLLAALAVLATALAEGFNAQSLPALFRMVVAATVPILVYGIIQIYGFDVDKNSPWDFVNWHHAYHNVFTTLGNPNHMAGFLVTVLPLGVVTAVLVTHRWLRVVMWGWVAIALLLLLQTAARGAWLGAVAAGAVLVVGMLPRLRAKARTVSLVGAGALIVIVALVSAGSHFLGGKASLLFKFGSGSSTSQRLGYWKAAVHLGLHHPLVGTGPDTFAATYARYQSASLAKQLGSTFFVNGAHNIFLSWLANEGVPGLLLILGAVASLAWPGAYGCGRCGPAPWILSTTVAPVPVRDETRRYVVTALVAGLVGYFVQACFDVEQVGTMFGLFVILGFLGVANRGMWSMETLVGTPFRVRGTDAGADDLAAEEDPGYPVRVARAGTYGRSATQARRELRRATTAARRGSRRAQRPRADHLENGRPLASRSPSLDRHRDLGGASHCAQPLGAFLRYASRSGGGSLLSACSAVHPSSPAPAGSCRLHAPRRRSRRRRHLCPDRLRRCARSPGDLGALQGVGPHIVGRSRPGAARGSLQRQCAQPDQGRREDSRQSLNLEGLRLQELTALEIRVVEGLIGVGEDVPRRRPDVLERVPDAGRHLYPDR